MGIWIALAGIAGLAVTVIWLITVHIAGLRTWMTALGGTGIASTIGSAIGLMAVDAAIHHNRLGEYVSETGAVNYLGLFEIFVSWFVVVGLAASLVLAFLVLALRGLRALYRLLRAQISS